MGDVLAHFETGSYQKNSTFLEDQEYGRALDVFVKGCADILVYDESKEEILIMKRTVHPQPDWWFVGGRMQAGETPQQSAWRNMRRETGLDLPTARFEPLCVMTMAWQYRKQEPAGNGTADVSVVFLVRVTPEERTALRCASTEHSESAWAAPAAVAADELYHPALRRAAQHVLITAAYKTLETTAAASTQGSSSSSDAAIAAAARALLAASKEAQRLGQLPARFVDIGST